MPLILTQDTVLPADGLAVHRSKPETSPITLTDTRASLQFFSPVELELLNVPLDWQTIELLNETLGSGNPLIKRSGL